MDQPQDTFKAEQEEAQMDAKSPKEVQGQPYATRSSRNKPRRSYADLHSPKEEHLRESPSSQTKKRKKIAGKQNDPPESVAPVMVKVKKKEPVFPRIEMPSSGDESKIKCVLKDGTVVRANDHVYLVCEQPGEPYYLARVMEFVRSHNDPSLPPDTLRLNWFYRPRDIQRQHSDSRLLLACMHSDTCPLGALRGRCTIKHRAHIKNLDEYRKQPDCFWYERLFDRYIMRHYEVVPTEQVLNVPKHVLSVLRERWQFVVVELGRGKELSMAERGCSACQSWCSSNDSVRCAICKSDYHLHCLNPPLARKPSRGFGWTCVPCTAKEHKRIESIQAPDISKGYTEGTATPSNQSEATELDVKTEPDNDEVANVAPVASTEASPAPQAAAHRGPTEEQRKRAKLWPFRYLGIHCNVEDVLDYDDRIYPRASSRISSKCQANVPEWHGHHVEFIDAAQARSWSRLKSSKSVKEQRRERDRKRYREKVNEQKRAAGLAVPEDDDNEPAESIDELPFDPSEPLPPWVEIKPKSFAPRGGEETSTLLYSPSREGQDDESKIQQYLKSLEPLVKKLHIQTYSTNFMDAAMQALYMCGFDADRARDSLKDLTRKSLGEPTLTDAEIARFEDAVRKHGSELYPVVKAVGTKKASQIVRFYYMWKKTPSGQEIWGNFEGRKPKPNKEGDPVQRKQKAPPVEEQAGDSSDDSAYDEDKAVRIRKIFRCKFCKSDHSPKWRRAPGSQNTTKTAIIALCQRCAEIWRRYGVEWEDPSEIARKYMEPNGKVRKRYIEEELYKEYVAWETKQRESPASGISVVVKNQNGDASNGARAALDVKTKQAKRKRESSKFDDEMVVDEKPKVKPCAVCSSAEPEDKLLDCSSCTLRVHSSCFGARMSTSSRWKCDACENDVFPSCSTIYECVLCPVREPDTAQPVRQPLKRTSGNNWAHVLCALFVQELRFGDPAHLSPVEGIGALPYDRWDKKCSVCEQTKGVCVHVSGSNEQMHASCAVQAGCRAGFEMMPIKSTRRDQNTSIRFAGNAGVMTPVIYSPKQNVKKITFHGINEVASDTEESAILVYAKKYRGSQMPLTRSIMGTAGNDGSRRTEFVTNSTPMTIYIKTQEAKGLKARNYQEQPSPAAESTQSCRACGIDVSPFWWNVAHNGQQATVCHRCYFQIQKSQQAQQEQEQQQQSHITASAEASNGAY